MEQLEEKEMEAKEPPSIFTQGEYGKLARRLGGFLNQIPHDPLRRDCTELENPLREIPYETD